MRAPNVTFWSAVGVGIVAFGFSAPWTVSSVRNARVSGGRHVDSSQTMKSTTPSSASVPAAAAGTRNFCSTTVVPVTQ